MIVFSLLCWGASLFIPRDRRGRARTLIDPQQYRRLDRRPAAASARRPPHLVGRAGDQLVLAGRRRRAVAAAAAGQERARRQRGGRAPPASPIFSISIAIGSGLAAWLAAGRIILLPTLIGAVLLGLFAIDLGWSTYAARRSPSLARLSGDLRARAAASSSPSISPASRSPAACSSCRPSPPCRPGPAPTAAPAWSPASTCSMPPSWRPSTVARRAAADWPA